MNYKGEIQYVRFYTAGSAAEKLAPKAEKKVHRSRMPAPAAQSAPRPKLVIEPFALAGTAIALVLAILVVCGVQQVYQVSRQQAAVSQYVSTLLTENAALQTKYDQSYDLETVRNTAQSEGLVPVEQVRHIKIHVEEPVQAPQPTFWEHVWAELKELFA